MEFCKPEVVDRVLAECGCLEKRRRRFPARLVVYVTLLMLVCAFADQERVLAAYAHAVRARYRFFSYGDAMLITSAGHAGVRP